MTRVVGVRFRTAGKIYFFDPAGFEIDKGEHVIVETARGIEFGTVVGGIREVEDDKVVQPLKPVLRIANERDREQEAANKEKEREAYKICLEKIQKHGLEMKLIDAEYTFDNNKVLFYFTADGRIDFRELVKDLASVFKTRIELRQIGVRDETKTMGGIGICGRVLCCHSYLSDFIPVSIKMAKEQNLSLNPAKISGVCGRLMCCLKHEEETYEELNRKLPGVGDHVTTEDGLKGEVQSVNVLRQTVKVIVEVGDEKEIREYEPEKLTFNKRRHGKKEKQQETVKEEASAEELSREELKELEMLEKQAELESQEQDDGVSEQGERDEKSQRSDRRSRSRRNGKGEKGGAERADRTAEDRTERREKTGRSEGDRTERRERPEKQGRQEKQDRREKQERTEHRERPERQERAERRERAGAPEGDRAERRERAGAPEGDRPERQGGRNRRRYGGRPGQGNRPEEGRAEQQSRPETDGQRQQSRPETDGQRQQSRPEEGKSGQQGGSDRHRQGGRRNRNRRPEQGQGAERGAGEVNHGRQEGKPNRDDNQAE